MKKHEELTGIIISPLIISDAKDTVDLEYKFIRTYHVRLYFTLTQLTFIYQKQHRAG